MPTPCTLLELCEKVNCLEKDVASLWDKTHGKEESIFIAAGNVGIPTVNENIDNPDGYARDLQDYTVGSAVINSYNPKGLFLVGNSNFDALIDGETYQLFNQEKKITQGFGNLLLNKRVYPALSDFDYYPAGAGAVNFQPAIPMNSIEDQMNATLLRITPYLSDAKRYYSVYDEKSSTEFFVLSSGRFSNYYQRSNYGFIYPDDALVGGPSQYTWFIQRATVSPARNKVVIFSQPFVSMSKSMYGDADEGLINVFNDFTYWGFEELGIRLIINGHSGNSFHLTKGSMHVVNCSSFARSRQGLSRFDYQVPVGDPGWAIAYQSVVNEGGEFVDGVPYPEFEDPADWLVPRTEIFKMICTREGITGKFISYKTTNTNLVDFSNTRFAEHTFEISAI